MHRIARYLCVAGLALASVSTAAAKQGRDFAGTYQLSNISEAGNLVHVTITLKVFNYSGADIRNSGVALFSSDANHEAIGAFAMVKLFQNSRSATLVQAFTVPKTEFQRWQLGAHPNFGFVSQAPNGAIQTLNVDVMREIDAPPAVQ